MQQKTFKDIGVKEAIIEKFLEGNLDLLVEKGESLLLEGKSIISVNTTSKKLKEI